MNKTEFWLMNNPIRSMLQLYEAKIMKDMTDSVGQHVLEIGCGQGNGTKLINKLFKVKKIVAIDLDTKMVNRAKRRVKKDHIKFQQASVTDLPFQENMFDAVFDFGILHHIPNWEKAIEELYRVLKPGGKVVLEDLSTETFNLPVIGWLMRKFLDHPYQDMFNRKEFLAECKRRGFVVTAYRENFFWFNAVLEKQKVA